jgi:hypothetical protein
MKKLLTITALGLSLGISSLSFADTTIFGVGTSVTKSKVSKQIRGKKIELNNSSFYLDSKNRSVVKSVEARQENSKDNERYIFGVKVNV